MKETGERRKGPVSGVGSRRGREPDREGERPTDPSGYGEGEKENRHREGGEEGRERGGRAREDVG